MNRSLCVSLLLLLGMSAFVPAASAADPLLRHVNGYTLDGSGKLQRFQALLVNHGKVVATSTDAALARRAGHARVIDGGGRTLLPGLTDAHGHVMALGQALNQADLSTTTTLAAALATVKRFAAAHPDAAWVQGGGWNQVIWKLGRFPTVGDLNQAVADRPAWLSRVDGHAGWANSAAMKLAGITRDTRDPTGGRIERDAQGNPTGVFVDGATALIERRVPASTAQESAAMLDSALAALASVGLTSVDDAGIDLATWQLYRRYADQHRLTARIYAMIHGTGKDFDIISRHGPLIGYGNDFLTVRTVKLYADGALGSRGAALLAPPILFRYEAPAQADAFGGATHRDGGR